MEPTFAAAYGQLTEQAREAWDQLTGFVRTNYAMDELWNQKDEYKFRRGGKTLLTLYFKQDAFEALVILGRKEREAFEEQRQRYGGVIQAYYDGSKTYHDGKWMFIRMENTDLVEDICRLLQLKRRPRPQ